MRQTLSASSNLWTYTFLLLFILIINRGYKFNVSHSVFGLRIFERCINDIELNSNNPWCLSFKLNFIVMENNCNMVINFALATVVHLRSLFERDVFIFFVVLYFVANLHSKFVVPLLWSVFWVLF